MRRASIKFPPRLKVLNAAKTTYYIKSKKGTDVKRVSFLCAECKKDGFASKNIAVDHKIPVVCEKGFIDWNSYVEKLFCDEANWQVLCKTCHDAKSATEHKQRYFVKKK